MDENRINARVNRWAESKSRRNCKNWNFRVNHSFEEANTHAEDLRINSHNIKERIFTHFHEKFKSSWQNDVNRDTARNGNGGNKLRRYKTFKTDYVIETYVK